MKNRYTNSKSQIGRLFSILFVLLMFSFVIIISGCLDTNGNDEGTNAENGVDALSGEDDAPDEDNGTEQAYFSSPDVPDEPEPVKGPTAQNIIVPITQGGGRHSSESASPSPVLVTGITITGEGSATSVIIGQSLQMNADVLPAAATDKTVVWSVINGTGNATINATGSLTGIKLGSVTVKATANDVSGVEGTLVVTVTEPPVLVTSITVTGAGSLTNVINGQTLQMNAAVLPVNATNKNVTWSVINGTGSAVIDQTGLLTATGVGNITVKATADDASGAEGTMELTIDPVLVTGIAVTGAGSATSVITGQTLQMNAAVTPADATDSSVTWSVIDGTGSATIDSTGLLTATGVGNVTVKAIANDASSVEGSMEVTIDPVLVTSIIVEGDGCANSVVNGQTLQMNAVVTPLDATDSSVTWSVINGTGNATIDPTGLLTATKVGTVIVKATANDASGVQDTMEVTIDPVLVTGVTVTSAGSVTSVITGNALQMNAAIIPADATDSSVIWSVINGTGSATIDQTGLLTAVAVGNVTVKATSNDASGIEGTLEITIAPVLVTDITVTGDGSVATVVRGQALQMNAAVMPANATDKTVTWSVVNDTGKAVIDANGLLAGTTVGNVTVKATANDASATEGTCVITVTPVMYTVTFDSNGGDSGAVPSAMDVAEGSTVVSLPSEPTKVGHTFEGWNTQVDALGTSFTVSTVVNADITVYAMWEPETYTVTFDNNGGDTDADPTSKTAVYNTILDALPSEPTKTGHTFEGWNTQANGLGTSFIASTVVTDDITVYAVWEPITYTVTFDKNGGDTDADPASKTADYGMTIDPLPTEPTKADYSFEGWNAESDGSGTSFTTSTTVTGDITVYAVWEEIILVPAGTLLDAAQGSDFTGVLYTRDSKLYYNQESDGKWSGESWVGNGTEGRIAIDSSDNAHAAYTTDGKIGYRVFDGSGWGTEELVLSNNGGSCSKPDIAVDGDGDAHITYTDTKGQVGGYSEKDDIMYTNSSSSFVKTVIYNGYYEHYGGADYYGMYYLKGSYITVDEYGNYYILTHSQSYSKWMGGADRAYTVVVASNLGTGATSAVYTDVLNIYDIVIRDGKPYALYKHSGIQSSELSASGGVINFVNTMAATATSAYSHDVLSGDIVVGSKSGNNLQTNYNGISAINGSIVVEGNAVSIVNDGADFYAFYTDAADHNIKSVLVAAPVIV